MLFDQAIEIPEILQSEDITVALLEERVRYSLRIKSADVAAFKKATGLKLPVKMHASSEGKDVICMKLGPDEWFVIAAPQKRQSLDAALAKASKSFTCSVTEVSHRNVGFIVSGPRAQALINVGCPLDLSSSAFPIGKATRSVFESSQIAIMRTGEDNFHIECWRSFGPYLRDFFERVVETR